MKKLLKEILKELKDQNDLLRRIAYPPTQADNVGGTIPPDDDESDD